MLRFRAPSGINILPTRRDSCLRFVIVARGDSAVSEATSAPRASPWSTILKGAKISKGSAMCSRSPFLLYRNLSSLT